MEKDRKDFAKIKCPDCENAQVAFLKASSKVLCQVCGATLSEPSGGRAIIKGTIIEHLQ